MLMCLSAAVLALAACGESTPTPTPGPVDPVTPTVNPTDDLTKKVTVTMDVGYQDSKTGMKFTADALNTAKLTKYSGLDGNEYESGDFKPAWNYMQKQLNFAINDVFDYKTNVQKRFENLKTNSYKLNNAQVNIGQGNADQIQSAGVVDGTILNLAQYLDMMPNFKKFLEDNPSVKKIVNASDGGIYYAPYFDGYDDIEKMLLLRQDWVEKLLDSTDVTFDGKAVDMKKYTPVTPESVNSTIDVLDNADGTKATKKITVTKKHTQNVITKQNALASQTGAELVKALREYIDATYGNAYSKRSELFIGGKAAYDIDELVALFRCVKANPGALTGDANKVIVPFLPREITDQRISDFWRFLQFFGVRGGESRNGWFYVKDDGTLGDMRAEEGTMNALDAMHKMYEEGLILQNFDTFSTVSGTKSSAADLFEKPAETQQGFAMYDYVQTQTIRDDNVSGLKLVPVMPGVWDWKESGKYSHYTESWRSVKPNGWFITRATAGDQDVLYRCLKIFDYQYSEEGNRLMSYGPDAYIAKKSDGKTLDTITYMGKQVPKLSDDTLAQLKALTKGNYTNYYRYFVGGTFPIGYIKEQGMEYQTTSATAQPHLMGIENAINLGVLEHPNHNTNNTKGLYDIVPAALAYSTTEQNTVSTMTAMSAVFSVQSSTKANIFNSVVIKGWDSADLTSFKASSGTYDLGRTNYLKTVKETLQVESFLNLSNAAYARMGMNSRKK